MSYNFNRPVEKRALELTREMKVINRYHDKDVWQWRAKMYGKMWDLHHKKLKQEIIWLRNKVRYDESVKVILETKERYNELMRYDADTYEEPEPFVEVVMNPIPLPDKGEEMPYLDPSRLPKKRGVFKPPEDNTYIRLGVRRGWLRGRFLG